MRVVTNPIIPGLIPNYNPQYVPEGHSLIVLSVLTETGTNIFVSLCHKVRCMAAILLLPIQCSTIFMTHLLRKLIGYYVNVKDNET